MLLSELSVVRAAHIVLASVSPQRSAILNDQLQLGVRAVPSTFGEDLDKSRFTPAEYAQETARQKALEVYRRSEKPFLTRHSKPPSLVIGADTIAVLGGEILEKPSSREEAQRMLEMLSSAGTHTVYTGVSCIYGGSELGSTPHEHTFVESTTVTFRSLTRAEIEAYVESGESMGKAGAYGIQGLGGTLVTKIEGDYQNVVGFPASRFFAELDCDRLGQWVRAQAESSHAGTSDVVVVGENEIVSDECLDLDECGLPAD